MSIRSIATRLGLTALLLTGSLQAQAYIEQEQSTGVANDAPSMAETAGTLSPGGYLFISGARRTEAGVTDNGGGSSADFFRFDVGSALSATLLIETPTSAAASLARTRYRRSGRSKATCSNSVCTKTVSDFSCCHLTEPRTRLFFRL